MAIYYIKSGGNDSYSGLSDELAWRTISKVNSYWSSGNFVPGDRICFRKGDTFYGQIVVSEGGSSSSPITITSYGTGNKPIITGFTTLTGSWTSEGGNIYSRALSSAKTNMVLVDGVQYGMGRYPQLGTNLTYTTGTITSITDPELPSTPNWTGAEVVINKYDWVLDRYVITNHSGTTITYSNPYGFEDMTPGSNRYYFIQNDIRCLTATNNWFHSTSTNRLYIYGDPSTKIVEVATLENCIYNNGYDYIKIDDIECKGSIGRVINFTNGTNYCNINNCVIKYGGQQGIYLAGILNVIDLCEISNCNSAGIHLSGSGAAYVYSSYIHDIGLIPGQSYIGEITDGIYIGVSTIHVEDCVIQNIGYNGMHTSSGVANMNIRYNYIDNVCLVLDDGGGIYSVSNGDGSRIIEYNIISNVGYTAPSDVAIPRGIYLDEINSGHTIRYNTIFNCRDGGIMIHKGYDNIIHNNTVFNCKYCLYFLASTSGQIYGTQIYNNKFIAKSASQRALFYYNGGNDIRNLGTLYSNYYSRPIDNDYVIYTRESTTGYVNRDIANWKSYMTPQDASSTSGSVTVSNEGYLQLIYNETYSNKYFELSTTLIDITGTSYNGTITLSPWESLVLIGNGIITEVEDPSTPEDYIAIDHFRLNKYSIL